MNPQCARCGKVVYPTEKVNCLDKYWHKGCFHCEVCKMALNMNNYKGYEKKPYCNAHYPKQSFTTVADTPENLRLKQQSELQSQVKYKRDFEESKGRAFSVVTDTPELQRLKRTQEQISNTLLYLSGHTYSEHILKPDILFVESPDVTVINNYATSLQFLWIFGGDESQNGGSPRHKYPFMNDSYLRTAVPPLPVCLPNKTRFCEKSQNLKRTSGLLAGRKEETAPNIVSEEPIRTYYTLGNEKKQPLKSDEGNSPWGTDVTMSNTEREMRVPVFEDIKDETKEEKTEEEENEEDRVFFKPVIEDLSMELARRCTELISDADEHRFLWVNPSTAENIRFVVPSPGKALTVERTWENSLGSEHSVSMKPKKGMDTTLQTELFACMAKEIHYKEEYKKFKDKCTFVTDTPMLNHVKNIGAFISEAKYKGTIKADLSNSLYKRMPATIDSVFAREVTQLQSEIAYKQKHDAAKGFSDYAHMKETPEIKHAMEVNKYQSNISYRKDVQDSHVYNAKLDRPDIKMATQISKIISNAEYKKGQGMMDKEPAVIGRPDFEHAVEASKLSSQIKYKEKFDNEMKDKKHHYNPLESVSFRQSQIATELASDVKYKKDIQYIHDPVSDLPTLFLDHALKVSKMLSGREYRKLFEENKGMYHFDADAAEHLHHKDNAKLQSQVKYKEKYEKNKGKSMLEFVETPSYQASKEAQKMQSEKVYKEDFEKEIKGRSSLDLDKTPEFLHVKYITNLLKEKEYKKDLENEIKGKGMELNSEVLDIQRAKRASEMASEKEYRKDLESVIKGKGMQVDVNTLEIQHARKASELASEKDYKRDLETEIKGKGMQVSTDTLDIQRAKKASEMASEKEYKKDLENEIKGKGMQVSMDIPDMLRAKRASEIYSQRKYKDEAEKMLSNYSTVADTPEIQRIKTTQQNISAVKYKEEIKHATAISDPPELKRVKENQKNISNLQYKEPSYRATPVSVTPEIERVKRNQEQLSPVKYKGEIKQATAISDPPELKRVKENQRNISNVYYKGQLGRATALSVTPEMERVKKNQENISSVKYTQDQKQMKGRPSLILDTPGLRHVKEAQNLISMVKYHEDFEKTKGRGFTPVMDDPVTERVRKNTQVVSDAAYKGVHPHIVEMDRRPGIIVDLKVWRTDPGSIFDIDPLEDNIQSRSLHMLSEKASHYRRQRSRSHSSSTFGTGLGDDKSEISEIYPSFSCCSEATRPSDEGAPVLPGAYQQSHSHGYGYMHQTSLSSMRSMQHSQNLRTYRAMYDYSAQDEDEVSFRDGDYIVNVQPIDDGWMYGTVQRTGKTGMLPANYIEFVN